MTPFSVLVLYFVFSLLSVEGQANQNYAQTDLGPAELSRAYRSVDSNVKILLDTMQTQLRAVTQNLDAVKEMCSSGPKKDKVAFSARLTSSLTSTTSNERVVFSGVVTNIGGAYNPATGIFTAPSAGVYVFAWTVLTDPKKIFDTELVVNGNVTLYNAADSSNGGSYESSGCTGVLQLATGDQVWIRKYNTAGNYLKDKWSSFSGFQLE